MGVVLFDRLDCLVFQGFQGFSGMNGCRYSDNRLRFFRIAGCRFSGYRSGSSFRMLVGLDVGSGVVFRIWIRFVGFGSFSFADTKMENRRGDSKLFR